MGSMTSGNHSAPAVLMSPNARLIAASGQRSMRRRMRLSVLGEHVRIWLGGRWGGGGGAGLAGGGGGDGGGVGGVPGGGGGGGGVSPPPPPPCPPPPKRPPARSV